jgi:hypothetical protein
MTAPLGDKNRLEGDVNLAVLDELIPQGRPSKKKENEEGKNETEFNVIGH